MIVTHAPDLAAAKAAVDEVVRAVDLAANRFREDSELSRLNAMTDRDVVISALLTKLIAAALRGARLTGGAVDPTVGSAIKLAGYDSDFAAVSPDGMAIELVVSRIPGWQAIALDEANRTVRLPRGVDIDLGATAKALTSDLAAAAALSSIGKGGALVSLGGDIAVAGEPPFEGWLMQGSEDSGAPTQAGAATHSSRAGGHAIASRTVARGTRRGGREQRNDNRATSERRDGPWRTATVVAGTCVDANIASTAALVMGEGAIQWLEKSRLPARLVDREGSVHRLAGWPKLSDSTLVSQQTHRQSGQH